MDKFGVGCGIPANVAVADPDDSSSHTGTSPGRARSPIATSNPSSDRARRTTWSSRARSTCSSTTPYGPQGSVGVGCALVGPARQFTDPTIADLLVTAGVSWAWYSGGLASMVAAQQRRHVPVAARRCPAQIKPYPCSFDPADVPFEYYASTVNSPNIQDLSNLATAARARARCPRSCT